MDARLTLKIKKYKFNIITIKYLRIIYISNKLKIKLEKINIIL
jgi:hypothetical protein